ncbi:MAG: glucose-6-phosphate isomerase [Candidatus Diapherotrites archaeon]|nr:glucose-6-phosphate isomerase [Candidatus Diapherotrites archaeon]
MFRFRWSGTTLKTPWKTYDAKVRRISDLKDVLLDEPEEDGDAYYMFRGVHRPEDEGKFQEQKVRYDITVIQPGTIGREYVKTLGHYHPEAGYGLSYPEVYEVLRGEALFLLQTRDASDFIAVKAGAGDVVIMLPNYGHVTVNVGSEPLIMANLVSSEFSSEYKPVKKKHGFAWYYTTEGWVKNNHYDAHPEIREFRPMRFPSDIYTFFVERPKFFEWLNKPWKVSWSEVGLQ